VESGDRCLLTVRASFRVCGRCRQYGVMSSVSGKGTAPLYFLSLTPTCAKRLRCSVRMGGSCVPRSSSRFTASRLLPSSHT
jgi:hypothetical protein